MKYIKQFFLVLALCAFATPTETKQSQKITRQQNTKQEHKGSLCVICGSMCSGKSEELIRQIGRFSLAGFNTVVFKSSIVSTEHVARSADPLTYISSRNGSWVQCQAVKNCNDMQQFLQNSDAQVIAIDEVMLFNTDIAEFISMIMSWVDAGKVVIIAGLDLDFRGEPFGPVPELLARADHVVKLTAICSVCHEDTYCLTQRLVDGQPAHIKDPLIVINATVKSISYEPRCRSCHILRKD